MSHRKPNESESKDQKPIIKKKPNLKELVIEEPEDTVILNFSQIYSWRMNGIIV
jgi:hypothetical protein